MTVHDLGYRGWSGTRAPEWKRPLVVAQTGVQRAWQSRWLRRMLFFAWLPAFWFGVGFLIWEQSLQMPEWREGLEPFLNGMPRANTFTGILREADGDPLAARHGVWAWLLLSFFRYPQSVLMILLVGLVAPTLISQDIRSRAFLLYFSRPLTRSEYILGKFLTVWAYLALISTLPALSLYLVGVLLSPELEVVWATWDLPFRILLASAALMIPTAALALCLSSMTQESRYAGFAWFAIWILGWFTVGVATSVTATNQNQPGRQFGGSWSHLSLYHTLGEVQSWIFGIARFSDVWISAAILVVLTVVTLTLLYRNVAAPMRA